MKLEKTNFWRSPSTLKTIAILRTKNQTTALCTQSNHPKSIIDQIQKMIEAKLCRISCTEHELEKAKPVFQSNMKN